MPRVIYIGHDGERTEIEAEQGQPVMKAAVNNGVPGIVGECGGELECATCHVYVDKDNTLPLPPLSEDEDEMLEAAACERRPNSRLSCQIPCCAERDGLVVHTPRSQY